MYYPNLAYEIYLEIKGVVNPLSVKQTDSFKFYTMDSSNNILSQFTGSDAAKYTPEVATMTFLATYPKRTDSTASTATAL